LGKGSHSPPSPAQLILQEDAFSAWNYRQVNALLHEPEAWNVTDISAKVPDDLVGRIQLWDLVSLCYDVSPLSKEVTS
jgi:hypothetical protein